MEIVTFHSIRNTENQLAFHQKEGKLPRAAPHLDVSEAWSLTSLRFSYKWALSLFGGSSRERSYWYTDDCRPGGDLVRCHRAQSFGRDTHGAVREEGDTRLASQISRINPSDQWGDRCRSQIALTSEHTRRPRSF